MKIAVCCLSNGRQTKEKNDIDKTLGMFESLGYEIMLEDEIYNEQGLGSESPQKRAGFVNKAFSDPEVLAVVDISGGDIAQECLPYLDFKVIKESKATFWGFSDLTCIINAIYSQTEKQSNLMWATQLARTERLDYMRMLLDEKPALPQDIYFIQGKAMQGVLVGGNIRCLLKLKGTSLFPDLKDKILFLEGYSNSVTTVKELLGQLEDMGAFDRIRGLILGQFTYIDKEYGENYMDSLIKGFIKKEDLPIARTHMVGHSKDSLALRIGDEISVVQSV